MNSQIQVLNERILLLENEVSHFRHVSEYSLEWSVLKSKKEEIIFVSPSCYPITGYQPEEFLADPDLILNIIHEDDAEKVKESIVRHDSSGSEHIRREFRILTKDHIVKWMEHYCYKQCNAEGRFICYLALFRDITDRKKSEDALRLSEEKFQKAFHQNPCLVGISTMDTGEYVEVNHSFYDTLGFSPEEVIGKRAADLFKDYTSKRDKFISKIMSQGFIKNEEVVINKKDGTDVIVSLAAEVLRLKDKDHLLVSAFDITELRQARNDLIYYSGLLEILMDISTNYINLPVSQIDKGLNEALNKVGKFVAADRAYLFAYDLEEETATCTHEWCNEGVDCKKEMFQRVSLEFFADYNSHRHGKTFHVPDINQLTDDRFRRLLLALGIKSLITIPLMNGEECMGFVGFDSVNTPHNFSEREQAIFDLFSKVLVNISLREKDHKELVLSNQRFNAIYENAPIFLAALDKNDNAVLWNKHCERTFGYTLEELQLTDDPLKLLFPDPEIRNAVYKVATQSPIGEFLTWYPFTKNGEQLITNWLNFALPDGMIINLGYDITAQRKAEEKILESEAKYKMLFENMNEAFMLGQVTFDKQGIAVDWQYLLTNPVFDNSSEIQADFKNSLFSGKKIDCQSLSLIQLFFDVATTGKDIRIFNYKLESGRYYDLSLFCPLKGQFALITRDVTQKWHLQTALADSEKKFRQLVELAQEGIWSIDANALTTYVNPYMASMLGYSVDEMIGKPLLSFIRSIDFEKTEEKIETRKKGLAEMHDFEFLRTDGKSVYASINTAPIMDEMGNYAGALALISDVTDRKRAEIELVKTIERFNLISEFSRTIYWEVDLNGGFSYLSTSFRSIFGHFEDDIITINDFLSLLNEQSKSQAIEIFLGSEEKRDIFDGIEILIETKGGLRFWLLVSGFPVKDDYGKSVGYKGSAIDITDKKRQQFTIELNLKKINDYKFNLQRLNNELIETEESEKRKIAYFLHDDLGQLLAAIHLKFTALMHQFGAPDLWLQEEISRIVGLINLAIGKCRRMTYELVPPVLYEQGLIEALIWKLNELKTETGIDTKIFAFTESLKLKDKMNVLVFRTISELLNNAVKHAGCSMIRIDIQKKGKKTHFTVSDDGAGFRSDFNPDEADKNSFGLFSIKERLLAYGGQMQIESEVGKGSRIHVII